ncbi:MAG: iron ABC transporter permease [Eggerthellaceae bacterium]|nr:iron ABC transporter permease [Eggerthellaceae bacterium]
MNNHLNIEAVEMIILFIIAVFVAFISLCFGTVNYSPMEVFQAIFSQHCSSIFEIVINVRLPRVLCDACVGAALSLCGSAMQGLLRNPLAEGSTLGASSGASLGAVISMVFITSIPALNTLQSYGMVPFAILFALLSILLVMGISYKIDCNFSTQTIILVGVVFGMFATSIISLITVFAGNKVKTIIFWTMGSLDGVGYPQFILILVTLAIVSFFINHLARELNAFSISEDNAHSIGVNVRSVKLQIIISTSILLGVCVAIGGTIAFVGLIVPHITRHIFGPNHRRLLPCSRFTGAIFLMIVDLIGRIILAPSVIPIGVMTSLVGAVLFVYIFWSRSRGRY